MNKERLSPHTDKLIFELIADSVLVRTDEKGRKFLSFENLLVTLDSTSASELVLSLRLQS